ncbi:MAG: glycosyltransferase [Clostridiales bacterium]|nr:glycosyltransferase [Clostridiales bacterium]
MLCIDAIVPVYNVELYLRECIDSLLNQTVPFHRIILINDGSIDSSREICEEYCIKYNFIELVNQTNHGLGFARNVGINHSEADYLVFVDSDDFVSADMVEKLLCKLNQEQIDVLIYNAREQYDMAIDQKAGYFKHSSFLNGKTMNGKQYIKTVFPRNYIVSACIAAYKRNFLLENNILFPEELFHEDYFFYLQVWFNAKKIQCMEEFLYVRRYRPNSITTTLLSRKRSQDLVDGKVLEWNYIKQREEEIESDIVRLFVLRETAKILNILNDESDPQWGMVEQLLEWFGKFWVRFLDEDLSWSESYFALQIVYKVKSCPETVVYQKIDIHTAIQKYRRNLEIGIKNKIVRLSAYKGKVGVYGIGAHTELLLELYRKYVGELSEEIFFVVSTQIENKKYFNREIITYDQLTDDIDYIIVSSLVYQEEMVTNLSKVGISNQKIVTLYDENEAYDITHMYRMLVENE